MTSTTLEFATPAQINTPSIQIEESLLGGIMLDPDILPQVGDLPVAAFSISSHRLIYNAILAVRDAGRKPDLPTVTVHLANSGKLQEVGGQSKLAQLMDRIFHSGNVKQHADLLRENHDRHYLASSLRAIADAAESEADFAAVTEKASRQMDRVGSESRSSLTTEVKRILEIESPVERWFAERDFRQAQKMTHKDFMALAIAIEADNIPPFEEWGMTAAEFAQKRIVDGEWLLDGLLKQGRLALLAAESKTGKSLLHYDLSYAVASGQPWGAFPAPKAENVLIVQTDEPEIDCQERIKQRGLDELDNVRIMTKFNPHQLPRLKKFIKWFQPKFIVLDSLTSIQRFSGYSPNDAEYGYFLQDLKNLASDNGCTVLLVCHTNKNPVEMGLDKIAGSYTIPAAASDIFLLYRPKAGEEGNDLVRLLQRTGGRSGPPKNWKLELQLEDYSYLYLGETDKTGEVDTRVEQEAAASVTTRQAIIEFLEHCAGTAYEAQEIAELTRLNPNRTRAVLGDLFREGRILRRPSERNKQAKVYYIKKNSTNSSDHPISEETTNGSNISSEGDRELIALPATTSLQPVNDQHPISADITPQPVHTTQAEHELECALNTSLITRSADCSENFSVGDQVAHVDPYIVASTFHGTIESVNGNQVQVRWAERRGQANEREMYEASELRMIDELEIEATSKPSVDGYSIPVPGKPTRF